MDEVEKPRKRRRAVGPPGAKPVGEEPGPEPREEAPDAQRDAEWYLAERPPHHESR